MSPENRGTVWTLVTGASSGIGADLARRFARDGRNLALTARSRPRLAALARELTQGYNVGVRTFPVDLSLPGASARLVRRLQASKMEVEILVNNAGFGLYGPFGESDLSRQGEMLRLNVQAPTELCRLLAPRMVRRGFGRILNVASTAAFQPGPGMAVYCATKAYVLSFSQAIGDELRESGVTVTCLCPGPTETNFAGASGAGGARIFRALKPMSSQRVAEAGHRALLAGKDLVVTGFLNRLLVFSVRFVPIRAATVVARVLLGG